MLGLQNTNCLHVAGVGIRDWDCETLTVCLLQVSASDAGTATVSSTRVAQTGSSTTILWTRWTAASSTTTISTASLPSIVGRWYS